ncbi:MAG: hypothetical protein M3Z33_13740 [Actinomycetota bacterium]|nr:hypothetical protein [Actinomycetota bacterium]
MAPWLALLVALTAVFGLPTLVKWFQDGTWRDGLYVDRDRSPWLDLLLAAAVTATVFAARDTHVSGVWYATVWWHLACLVAVIAFVFWRCDVEPSHVRQLLTTGGEPRHIRNVGYTLIAAWMVGLIPTILFSGPVWSRPINLLVLGGLFALSIFGQRLIRWAGYMDDHIDSMEVRLDSARAHLSH